MVGERRAGAGRCLLERVRCRAEGACTGGGFAAVEGKGEGVQPVRRVEREAYRGLTVLQCPAVRF